MLKRLICVVTLIVMACPWALAEATVSFPAAEGAYINGEMFFIARESEGDVLIRFDGDGIPHAAIRAGHIRCAAATGSALYFLVQDEGWSLMRRGMDGMSREVYRFDPERNISCLNVYGDNLLLLVDGQLHMIYPENDLCLQMASVEMRDFFMIDNDVYFLPAGDPAPSGIYRLSIVSGEARAVVSAPAEDLLYADGLIYFRSGAASLEGGIMSYDIASGKTSLVWQGYDWGYCHMSGSLLVRVSGGLYNADGRLARPVPDASEMARIPGGALIFDPERMSIARIGG